MAAAWMCWLALVIVVVSITHAPVFIRATLILLLPSSFPSLMRFVLLRGHRAVQVLEWTGQGEFHLGLGPARRRIPARLLDSQRLGLGLWTLRFHTAEGRLGLLIDTALQARRPVRRLGRALERGDLLPSRPKV